MEYTKKERSIFQKPTSGNISYEKLKYLNPRFSRKSLLLQKKSRFTVRFQHLVHLPWPMGPVRARLFSGMCCKNACV